MNTGSYINWKCKKERSETNLETEEAERSFTDESDVDEEVAKGKKEEYVKSYCIYDSLWASVMEFDFLSQTGFRKSLDTRRLKCFLLCHMTLSPSDKYFAYSNDSVRI